MEETTTRLLFRAGREVAAFDEDALRTAEQAKRRAKGRGQGRLQHQASMLVTAIKANYSTTAALEMVKREVEGAIKGLESGEALGVTVERLEALLACLRSGEVEMPKPRGFWAWLRGLFSGGKR